MNCDGEGGGSADDIFNLRSVTQCRVGIGHEYEVGESSRGRCGCARGQRFPVFETRFPEERKNIHPSGAHMKIRKPDFAISLYRKSLSNLADYSFCEENIPAVSMKIRPGAMDPGIPDEQLHVEVIGQISVKMTGIS